MGGVYSHNKLIGASYATGKENLPALEDDVYAEESVVSSVTDDYETAIKEDWPNFIKSFCE